MAEKKKIEHTPGRVQNTAIPGTRVYFKPALRKVVFRKTGVARESDKVRMVNAALKELKPARECKGKTWREFVKCLRDTIEKAQRAGKFPVKKD